MGFCDIIQTTQSTTQIETGETDNTETLTDKDLEILNILKLMPEASQSVIAAEIGWDVNTVKYYIRRLREIGVLDRIGSYLDQWEWLQGFCLLINQLIDIELPADIYNFFQTYCRKKSMALY